MCVCVHVCICAWYYDVCYFGVCGCVFFQLVVVCMHGLVVWVCEWESVCVGQQRGDRWPIGFQGQGGHGGLGLCVCVCECVREWFGVAVDGSKHTVPREQRTVSQEVELTHTTHRRTNRDTQTLIIETERTQINNKQKQTHRGVNRHSNISIQKERQLEKHTRQTHTHTPA